MIGWAIMVTHPIPVNFALYNPAVILFSIMSLIQAFVPLFTFISYLSYYLHFVHAFFFYNLVYVHCFCLCAFHTCFQVLIIWYLLNEERGHFWKGKKGGPWFLVNHILSFDPDGECQALKCGSICHIFQGVLSS